MDTYSIAEFARRLGVTVKTLQRWDREGRLVALRTPTHRRVYTDEHLYQILPQRQSQERATVVYIRVSSQAHKARPGKPAHRLIHTAGSFASFFLTVPVKGPE